jgi:hypothetical protein
VFLSAVKLAIVQLSSHPLKPDPSPALCLLTMPYPDKFTGFQVNGPETWLEFHKNEFQPKPFGDYDVDVKIECCGVCASDVHTISGGWGKQHFPLAVGHGRTRAVRRDVTQAADRLQRSLERPSG